MDQIKVYIKHYDTEYALDLGRALALRCSIFSIYVEENLIVGAEDILQIIAGDRYDILLVDQNLKHEVACTNSTCINAKKLVGLTATPNPPAEKKLIYMYGGLDLISSEIQIIYAENSDESRFYFLNDKTMIIGFTSAAGGVGVSSITISTAKEMVLSADKDVLYISFEEIESTPVYIPTDTGRLSISEYLYYLFTDDKRNVASFIDAFLVTDNIGLSVFRPARCINELAKLNCNLQLKFLKAVSNSLRFDYIFVDFHSYDSLESEHLMGLCQKIVMVDDGHPLSLYKNKSLIENISIKTLKKINDKIIQVTNKWDNSESDMSDCNIFCVEYDPESFSHSNFKTDISLNRRFGLGIRRIADELTTHI